MAVAFVLINTETGAEREILEELKMIKEVKEAHRIHGVYDVIVQVEADSVEMIKDVLVHKIRNLNKLRSTLTMLCID